MKNKILTLAVFVTLTNLLLAGGGSIYSRYGLGELHFNLSAKRFAIGELGFGLGDKDHLSLANPAAWSQITLTRFETGLTVNAGSHANAKSSVFNSNSYFNGFMIGLPISRENGISLTGGIVPYSNVGYEIATTGKNSLVDPFKTTYKGEGGLFKIFFGSSYKLPLDFSVGASFDYFYGRTTNSTSIAFDTSKTYSDATFIYESNHRGISTTLGLQSPDISKLFDSKDFKDFRIGLSFAPQVTLNTDTTNVFSSVVGEYENNTGQIKTKLPYRLGVGASFRIANNYTFVLDYMTQPMSELSFGNMLAKNMQDVTKYSFGAEYKPSYDVVGFFNQISIRGGISYETTPYKFGNTAINQFSIYAGCSLPVGYENTIDIGFQYANRGTTDNKLLSENIYKVNFSLSFGELWFIQSER